MPADYALDAIRLSRASASPGLVRTGRAVPAAPESDNVRIELLERTWQLIFATYTDGVIALLEDVIARDGKSWEMP